MDEKDRQIALLTVEASMYKGFLHKALEALISRPDVSPDVVLKITESMRAQFDHKFPRGTEVDFVAEHIDRIFDDLQKRYSQDQ